MNWIKLKNIMLWFLIFMNILLISIITISTFKEKSIPDNAVKAAIELLEKDGFSCKKEIFPKNYETLPSLSAQFYTATELSDMFFGTQVAFKTENNSLIATADDATLTVTGNYFLYETESEPVNSSDLAILSKLKKLGMDMRGASYDSKTGYFYKMYNNLNLFNISLQARLDKNEEICYLSAHWPQITSLSDNKHLSFTSEILKIKDVFPNGGNITDIELGYSMQYIRKDKYMFNPAWRVTVNNETKIVD